MRHFTYLIHGFKNLTISYSMLIAVVIVPVWANGDYQSKTDTSKVCSGETMNESVKTWKADVEKFKTEILPRLTTRGGEENLVLTLFPLKSNSSAKLLAGKRKLFLTWNGGKKPYHVKIYTTTKEVLSKQIEEPQVSTTEQEFKDGEYWVEVKDANDQKRNGRFTIVDNATFFEQRKAIEEITALSDKQTKAIKAIEENKTLKDKQKQEQIGAIQRDNDRQKKWFMVVLLLSHGEKWKLEAYQQIADQSIADQKNKDKDAEFSLAKLGIEHGIQPSTPILCLSKGSSK